MAGLVQSTWAKLTHSPSKTPTFKMGFKEEQPTLIHVIQAKEELTQHIKGLNIIQVVTKCFGLNSMILISDLK